MGTVKQAVVIIHGIGEQRPLDTLRGFTDSMLRAMNPAQAAVDAAPQTEFKPDYWSEPDLVSESFELRRFSSAKLDIHTDFYEFYWAHHMEGTRYFDVWQWLRPLIIRRPGQIVQRLRTTWYAIWLLLLVVAGVIAAIYIHSPKQALDIATVVVSVYVLLFLANFIVIGWIGDAARYINPTPHNIARRQEIRAAGVRMLKRLHEQGNYDRIILVGHSLGSIIAYDILRYAWLEYHESHHHRHDVCYLALKRVERAGLKLGKDSPPEQIDDFRKKQVRLWVEQRKNGNPWLVTDFITLGSPLGYASMLLASAENPLDTLIERWEMPACPPFARRDKDPYSDPQYYSTQTGRVNTFLLNNAALFACTRWTNLFFPRDLVGGPLRGILGWGIKDVPIKLPRRYGWVPLAPHTWYWGSRPNSTSDMRRQNAIVRLREALELNDPDWQKRLTNIRYPPVNYPRFEEYEAAR